MFFFRNIAFFAGAMLAVLLAFSFYDQDVLKAEHVISTMAALGMIIKGCTAFIPEEVRLSLFLRLYYVPLLCSCNISTSVAIALKNLLAMNVLISWANTLAN